MRVERNDCYVIIAVEPGDFDGTTEHWLTPDEARALASKLKASAHKVKQDKKLPNQLTWPWGGKDASDKREPKP